MRKWFTYYGCWGLTLLVFVNFVGCTKEELDFEKFSCDTCLNISTSSGWNVPLASLSVSLEDFFDEIPAQADIKQNALGEYYYEFSDTLATFDTSDFVGGGFGGFPTQNFSPQFTSKGNSTEEIPIDTTFEIDLSKAVSGSDIRLKSMKLSAGNLRMNIRWNNTDTGDIRMSSFFIGSGGQAIPLYSTAVTFPITGATSSVDTALVIPLAGQSLALGTDASHPYNRIRIRFHTKLKNAGNVTLNNVSFAFNDENQGKGIKWELLKGFFRIPEIVLPAFGQSFLTSGGFLSSSQISYSKFQFSGSFVELQTSNKGFGIPIYMTDSVSLFKEGNLLHPRITINLYDNYPTDPAITSYLNTTKRISEGLDELLSQLPDSLQFEGAVSVSGDRSPTLDTNQFIRSDARYIVASREFVPMRFSTLDTLTYVNAMRTGDWDFDTTNLAVDSGALLIKGVNSFPSELSFAVYIRDKDGSVLDSIRLANFLPSAIIGSDGNVTQGKAFDIRLPISSQQVKHLMVSESLLFKFQLKKNDTYPVINFLKSNNLQIGVGVDAKLRVKLK